MNSSSERYVSMEQLLPLIAQKLEAGRSVRFSPMGVSMLPMLRQKKDSVILSPAPARLQKYDLPLYRRENGRFILHRIVKTGECYTCMGDNQFTPEPGVSPSQIIGVVTGFYRGDRYIPVTAPAYRFYCHIWHYTRPIRHFRARAAGWLRRHLKLHKNTR